MELIQYASSRANMPNNDDSLDLRAALLAQCSCAEEYIVRRDLEISLSRVRRIFDPIAFVARFPKISREIEQFDPYMPIVILLSSFTVATLIHVLSIFFSFASEGSWFACCMFSNVGIACISLAFVINIVDGRVALKFTSSLTTERKQSYAL